MTNDACKKKLRQTKFCQGYAYKEKHVDSDYVTFEQHQLDGCSTDIIQPIALITACLLALFNQSEACDQVSQLVLCPHMNINKEVKSQVPGFFSDSINGMFGLNDHFIFEKVGDQADAFLTNSHIA